jgi:hypothetical protein
MQLECVSQCCKNVPQCGVLGRWWNLQEEGLLGGGKVFGVPLLGGVNVLLMGIHRPTVMKTANLAGVSGFLTRHATASPHPATIVMPFASTIALSPDTSDFQTKNCTK